MLTELQEHQLPPSTQPKPFDPWLAESLVEYEKDSDKYGLKAANHLLERMKRMIDKNIRLRVQSRQAGYWLDGQRIFFISLKALTNIMADGDGEVFLDAIVIALTNK